MAMRYAGEFGSIRVAAGIGYRKEDVSADIAFTTKDDLVRDQRQRPPYGTNLTYRDYAINLSFARLYSLLFGGSPQFSIRIVAPGAAVPETHTVAATMFSSMPVLTSAQRSKETTNAIGSRPIRLAKRAMLGTGHWTLEKGVAIGRRNQCYFGGVGSIFFYI